MRRLVVCVGLCACRGGLLAVQGETDTDLADTDSGVIDTDTGPLASLDGLLVYQALVGPPALVAALRDAVDHGGCPSAAVASATDWTLSGGCSAGGVDWTGSGTFRRTADGERIQFGTLAYDAGDGPVSLTGEILVMSGTLDASHVARDANGDLVFAHAHTLYTPDAAATTVGAGGAGDYDVSGQLTVGGLGVFALSGSVSHAGACNREPDAGDLEATGASSFDFDVDGASSCDGCVPYSGTTSGEACGF